MRPASYEAVIEGLCEVAGVDGAAQIVEGQHVTLDGRLVGLIPDLDAEVPTLSVYIELGPTFPERDSALYARLLAENLAAPRFLPGRWGLHPETHEAVYALTVDLASLDGAGLAALLETEIPRATQAMARLSQPT